MQKALILSLLICISLFSPVQTVGTERARERDTFRERLGERYNGSAASFAGFETWGLRAYFVAGSPEDDYSAHFLINSNSTLANFVDNSTGKISKLQVMQVFLLSFPSIMFVKPGRMGEGIRDVISFTGLNWTIITNQIQVGESVSYAVKLSAPLSDLPISERNVTISINLQTRRQEGTQSVREIVADTRSYSFREKTVLGEKISVTMKMDHEIHGLDPEGFKSIILPVHLRIIQRILLPKRVFDLNYRPADFIASENADNESHRPEIRVTVPRLGGLNYSWVPTVSVDGKDFPVRVQNVGNHQVSRKGQLNSTHVVFTRDWTIQKGLIYPYGNNVVHDPDFALSLFRPIEEVISLNPSFQAFSLLIIIPLFVIVLFILGKKKKYP